MKRIQTKDSANRAVVVAAIRKALESRTGRKIENCNGSTAELQRLLATNCELGFMTGDPVTLRIDDHFDLHADGVVKDAVLGTLGIFHVPPVATETFPSWLRERINESVYVRHLLLTRSGQGQQRPLAYTIELTICFRKADTRILSEAGAILRAMALEGSFLHAIGINFWDLDCDSEGGSEPDQEVGRHDPLPWLLDATHEFISKHANLESAESSNGRTGPRKPRDWMPRDANLMLRNFRLPGTRTFKLCHETAVHVFYGPNGSGKSSIAEAVEVSLTGKVNRLGSGDSPRADHRRVLGNRETRGEPVVRLPGKPAMAIGTTGVECPIGENLNADSLLLNQDLADRLATGTSAVRAGIFINAFFQDKAKSLGERRELLRALDAAWNAVPHWWRDLMFPSHHSPPETKEILAQLRWCQAPSLSWSELLTALESIVGIGAWSSRLTPELRHLLRNSDTLSLDQAIERAGRFDAEISTARELLKSRMQILPEAIAALETVENLAIGLKSATGFRLEELFNQWLVATAEADLASRMTAVVETLRRAENDGTRPGEWSEDFREILNLVSKDLPSPAAMQIGARAAALADHASELAAQLESFETEPASRQRTKDSESASSSGVDFDSLDSAAAQGLLGTEFEQCQPRLGLAIKTALEHGRSVKVRSRGNTVLTEVGRPRWAGPLLVRLRQERGDAAELLEKHGEARSFADVLAALHALAKAAVSLDGSEKEVVRELETLLEQDGALVSALNEVMALLTPARWAYQPLRASSRFGQTDELELSDSDKVAISQRLNTAELNAIALAFFLLCARRVRDNSLQLLVLDDPLQNMDELTVTTVARALSKVTRLWRHVDSSANRLPWRLWILLHGEDDAERFRDELPCTFTRLPWAVPLVEDRELEEPDPIPFEESRLANDPQDLDGVLRPAADSA
jgi:hypothetical protein